MRYIILLIILLSCKSVKNKPGFYDSGRIGLNIIKNNKDSLVFTINNKKDSSLEYNIFIISMSNDSLIKVDYDPFKEMNSENYIDNYFLIPNSSNIHRISKRNRFSECKKCHYLYLKKSTKINKGSVKIIKFGDKIVDLNNENTNSINYFLNNKELLLFKRVW